MVRVQWLGLVVGSLLRLSVSTEARVLSPALVNGTQPATWVPRYLVERVRSCFDTGQLVECFRDEVFRLLDKAITGNVTFRVTPFVVVRKNPEWAAVTSELSDQHAGWTVFWGKMREFCASRLFQVSLVNPEDGRWLLQASVDEGRGKKHKQKNGGMFSMALMALMAMIAQVILGKVAVLAAVALIMAKIALVFSTLNGLKKANGASGGHASEHVVYDHGGGGGGGGGGGWQRSIEPNRKQHQRYQYSYDDEDLPYRKRKQVYDYQEPLDGA